jgi:hypothetical protein
MAIAVDSIPNRGKADGICLAPLVFSQQIQDRHDYFCWPLRTGNHLA